MKMIELNESILNEYRKLCDEHDLSEEEMLKSICSLAICMMNATGREEVSHGDMTLTLYDGR